MLSLLSVAATSATSLAPESSEALSSRPYLSAIGTPALRFAEPIPPPDLTVRPAAGAPPILEDRSTPTADQTKSDLPVVPPPSTPTTIVDTQAPATESSKAAPAKSIAPILPDDTRPKIRAEDFLPFFQFPAPGGANGDITVVAPAPGATTAAPLPPSSASYRQQ